MRLATLLFLLLATTTLTAAPPNIVIFLADDAGWGDYSHSGNTQVQTPHVDSLAREGVSLDRFYVQPVCSPTRAEMLTGWDPPLHTNQDTLPRPQGESQMKEFHTLMLGEITLPAGRGPLTLRALNIPGSSVMDVRRITLTLRP